MGLDKAHEFLLLRGILATVASIAQTELYGALSARVHPDVGLYSVLISMPSAGMYQAMPAFLPSSFAMSFVMLGTSAFLKTTASPVKALVLFSIAGLFGWPFSLALVIPQLLLWCLEMAERYSMVWVLRTLLRSSGGPFAVLTLITIVDSLAYRKLVFVPFNIVLYNVFGGEGRGPDLYGTEPWWYYLANLSLNFNIMLVAALCSGPLVLAGLGYWPGPTFRTYIAVTAQFYIWILIFSLQPHKEERFMYPAYPGLCLNAAVSLYMVKSFLSQVFEKISSSKSVRRLADISVFAAIFGAALISVLRIAAVTSGYSAPIDIYNGHHNLTGNVCYGKEWYRFPSSFLLPQNARPRFIKSAFAGLLPGSFTERNSPFRDGTWEIPENMNDLNQEDYTKYIPIEECDYLVDSYFEGKDESSLEPNYILDTEHWDLISCREFLDASKTPFPNRIIWLPRMVIDDKRVWAKYCILRKRS
ncbi:mannosyltransferase, variant 2 [Orbilia brochopaga]